MDLLMHLLPLDLPPEGGIFPFKLSTKVINRIQEIGIEVSYISMF
jgi:hypothetical protein